MDNFTDQHLTAWLDDTILSDERKQVEVAIRGFVAQYPDVVERMSWPEIRSLAERTL